MSWNRWIEPYVDTGRELMVPWRVSQGERLYRDVQFHHGPLAVWLGAACDGVFGRSLSARTGLAALIALFQLAALQALARGFLSAWRAALATSAAVAAAVFLRPGGWMFPFSFDCAIGVAALTGALAAAEWRNRSDGFAGFLLLAALLARVEMGLAGAVVLAVASRREPLRLLRLVFFPVASAAVVYAAVSFGIPVARLIDDGWLRVVDPPAAFRHVYREYAGLDALGLRLAELALAAVIVVLIAAFVSGVAAAAQIAAQDQAAARIAAQDQVPARLAAQDQVPARLAPRLPRAALLAESAGLVGLAGLVFLSLRPPVSLSPGLALVPPLVRVIPPLVVAAAAWRLGLHLAGREPAGPLARVPDAVLWLGALFAARVLLAAGYAGPYGSFFLPLPIVLAVAALLGAADRLAPAIGPALPRLTAGAVALFVVARSLTTLEFYRQPGWSGVPTPAGGVVLPEPIAATTRAALAGLATLDPPGGALAGFPESGFFAYVMGLRNPFWVDQFFPGHLDAAGERRAIAVLRSHPPPVLLYANVLAVGEGQRAFGTDYLRALDAAARERTATYAIYGPGARPGARIGDPDFFVELRVAAPSR